MHGRRDAIVFAVSTIVLSVGLAVPVWLAIPRLGLEGFTAPLYLVPVVSAMAMARGIGWKRKALFIGVTFGGFLVLCALWLRVQFSEWFKHTSEVEAAGVSAYVSLLLSYPLVMLALFVGKTPSALWSRPAKRATRMPASQGKHRPHRNRAR